MEFQVEALSIELIEALRPIVPRIKRHDRSLADQLTRAASSIALNMQNRTIRIRGIGRHGSSVLRGVRTKRAPR